MRFSVVVVAKNSKNTICYTLKSLEKQTKKPDEILVVVPSEEDNTLSVLESYPNVKLIISGRSTRGFQRAVGVRNATAEIIALIDSDCVADPKWLEALDEVYSKHNEVVAQGGPIIRVKDLKNPSIDNNYELKTAVPTSVKFLATANFSFKQNVVELSGNFDEQLHEGEDLDFCIRLLKSGFKIISNPKAIVCHVDKSANFFIKRSISYGKSRAQVFMLHKRYLASAALVAAFHFSLIILSVLMLIINRLDLFIVTFGTSVLHQIYKFHREHVAHKQKSSAIKSVLVSFASSYFLYFSFVVSVLYNFLH